MRILIVTYEAWRETNNGGNVLSNIFRAFPEAEIAQVYCSGEAPQNAICRKYFQISDSMLLKQPKGRRLEEKDYSAFGADDAESIDGKIKSRIPGVLMAPSRLARETMWVLFRWKTKALERFVTEFAPDLMFVPCCPYAHVLRVALYIKRIAQCPMISYVVDDVYSLRKFQLSPSFWIEKLLRRKPIRKFFAECALVYTMTQMQKDEYGRIFGRPMKILCKYAQFEDREKEVGSPIQLIYAGNLLWKRWKVLAEIAKAVAAVNETQTRAVLHVYTGTQLKPRVKETLNDGRNAVLHGLISYRELTQIYRQSDVAIFAESFDLKNRLTTRLSFSTKIIDCMNSGCAILAVGPGSQAGMAYLKDNDAAVCVNSIREISAAVQRLADQPALISAYAEKANRLGKKNHRKDDIEKMLRQDFYAIAAGDPVV